MTSCCDAKAGYPAVSLLINEMVWTATYLILYDWTGKSIVLNHNMERVTERLRRWARDLTFRGSIPEAPVKCKTLGQALNLHCLWSPSSNGYLVHRSKVGSTVAAAFGAGAVKNLG